MPNYLDRFKMASCPLRRDGFERKYAIEYSTAEEWASEF